jgi:hypothetical protein
MFPAHQSISIGACANITSTEKERIYMHFGAERQQKDIIGREEKE